MAGLSLAVVSTIMELRSDSSFEISALVIPVFPLVSTGLNWGCGGTDGSGGISPREDMNSSRLVGLPLRTERTVFSSIVYRLAASEFRSIFLSINYNKFFIKNARYM